VVAAIAVVLVLPLPGVRPAPARAQQTPPPPDAVPPETALPDPPSEDLGLRAPLPPLEPFPRVEVGGGTPLGVDELVASVRAHYPPLLQERERVRAAEAQRLAADGAFDLGIRADAKVASSYYDYVTAGVQLTQPTGLWGLQLYAGWRLGVGLDPAADAGDEDANYLGEGSIPSYYGELETLQAGEIRGGVRLPIWRDGPIDPARAGQRQAAQGLRAARAALTGRRLDLEAEAVGAYWSWVAAGAQYEVVGRLLDLAEERNAQIERLVERGALPFVELLENRRAIYARRQQLVVVRRQLEAAAISLSLYLRRDDGRPRLPRPDRLPPRLSEPGGEPLPEQRAAIDEALAQRPEIARFRALLRRSEVTVELADNQAAPRVDLKVEAAQDVGDADADQDDRLRPFEISGALVFETPLQRRALVGRLQEARADLRATEAQAQFASERVVARVLDATSAVEAARDRYALAAPSADVAERVAEAERRRFDLGSSSLVIVTLREQLAAAAAVEKVRAQAAVFQALADYRVALGRSPADDAPLATRPAAE